jgi:hypothetical protein
MSCTDKLNATRKLREEEREKKRERERERDKEREKEKERKREKMDRMEIGSLTYAFGTVDIQSQLSNYEQTTISEEQKNPKTPFSIYQP